MAWNPPLTPVPDEEYDYLGVIYVWTVHANGEGAWKIKGAPAGGGAVDSVFGRIGDVIAQPNDYAATQVDNDSMTTGDNVAQALNEIDDRVEELEKIDTPLVPRGGWEVDTNTIVGDPLNTSLTKGQAPEAGGDDPAGFTYIVTVPGSFDLTDQPGEEIWSEGDFAIWAGTSWVQVSSNAVVSVFGRTGIVVAEEGDYRASQVENDSTVRGAFVDDALDALEQEKATRLEASAMTAADFFALAEKRIRDNVGSGVVEWGLAAHTGHLSLISEGLYARAAASPNTGWIDRLDTGRWANDGIGISRTEQPIYNVNGIALTIQNVNESSVGAGSMNVIIFPPAEDGLTKADGTGRFADLNEAISAGGTELSESVINRQDFCFLEVWHEKVSDKDIVVPLGNVQYGATEWNGITLVGLNTIGVAQGYSAFGEWDTDTQGNGVQWSTSSDEDKLTFIQDPENNIYIEDGELIQVRYRIRIVAGLEGDWLYTRTYTGNFWRFDGTNRVQAKGLQENISSDLATGVINRYYGYNTGLSAQSPDIGVTQVFNADNGAAPSPHLAHNGLCFAVPICMVSRHNQGVFSPEYNSRGADRLTGDQFWYENPTALTSVADCFDPAKKAGKGDIASGVSGRDDGQFYDAIYAAYVQDLRVRADEKPEDEIREMYHRKAIANEVRGWERVPFTYAVYHFLNGLNEVLGWVGSIQFNIKAEDYGLVIGDIVYIQQQSGEYNRYPITQIHSSGNITIDSGLLGAEPVDRFDNQLLVLTSIHEIRAQEHTWTDCVGDPERIAATFPNGGYFQWIPDIPDGSWNLYEVSINRKSTVSTVQWQYTDNDGASWTAGSSPINTTTNTIQSSAPVGRVLLWHYKTSAHFTVDSVNKEVISIGKPTSGMQHTVENGALLCSSLIGKVPTSSTGKLNNDDMGGLKIDLVQNELIVTDNDHKVSHDATTLSTPNNDGPGWKTLSSLNETNGKYGLQLTYKEMDHTTSWGDNSEFSYVDNQTTEVDDNGTTILVGTGELQDHIVQYFRPTHKEG